MKKFISLLLVACLLTVCFAGCGSTEDSNTLIIGGIGPLTGDLASYGNSVKQGAQLAVDEINANGGVNGIQLELQFEDDQGDETSAVNAYSTLIDNGMKVSLGTVTSAPCVAVTEEVKKDGILMITPSGSQKECTQYDTCFRICFTDPDQGTYSADFIADNNIAKKIAIIYDKSNDYSVGIKETFVAEAAARGLEVVTEQAFTDQSKTDFSTQLQKVKESGAEMLFLPLYYTEVSLILTQADSMGVDPIIFGVDGMDGIIEQMGDKVALTEDIILLTPFAADATDDKTVSFVTAYKEAYNETPDQFAADGYDAVYTIAAAYEKSGLESIDADDFNEKMVAAMTQITVEGVTGTMTWSADGEPAKNATAVVIKNGVYTAYNK